MVGKRECFALGVCTIMVAGEIGVDPNIVDQWQRSGEITMNDGRGVETRNDFRG
jgi:hypothetical protein